MPLDGSIQMKHLNAVGSYYTAGNGTNKAPGKSDADFITGRQKVLGGIYDIKSADIYSDSVLNAFALYAEDHTGWKTCEVGAMGGPINNDRVKFTQGSQCTANKRCTHTFRVDSTFNALYISPVKSNLGNGGLLGSEKDDGYNPLDSFKDLTFDTTVEKKTTNTNEVLRYIVIGMAITFLAIGAFQVSRYAIK
jgi:hypothetical protein